MLVGQNYYTLSGNHRLQSAQALDWKTVDELRHRLKATVLSSDIYQFPGLVESYVAAKNYGGTNLPFTYAELVRTMIWTEVGITFSITRR